MAFENARDRTLELFRKRPGYQDWSLNLEEGSAGLTTDEDWKRFYQFLANPMGVIHENTTLPEEEKQQHTLPSCLEEVRYENGTDIIIHVKNKEKTSLPLKKIDGERVDHILKCVPEETPEEKHETMHERCSSGIQEEKTKEE